MKNVPNAALAILALACAAMAAEPSRDNITITKVVPLAGNRVEETSSRNIIRVYVNNATWPGTDCRADAFDLRKEDAHLYAAVLTAVSTGVKISASVDTGLRPVDTVCQATGIGLSP